jgi:hypothetical protein
MGDVAAFEGYLDVTDGGMHVYKDAGSVAR